MAQLSPVNSVGNKVEAWSARPIPLQQMHRTQGGTAARLP